MKTRLGGRIPSAVAASLAGALLTLACCVLLTGWGSLGICLGLPAESFLTLDWLVPVLAVFLGGGFAGLLSHGRAGEKSWLAGFSSALMCVIFWLGTWLLLTGRINPRAWWHDGFLQLTPAFLGWWTLALGLGALAGQLAGYCTGQLSKRLAPILALCSSLVIIPAVQSQASPPESFLDSDRIASWTGYDQQLDGTTVRLAKFDLKAIDFGIYDADADDSQPYDDANTTWLGQALPLVLRKVTNRNSGRVLCLVNGGFFGATWPFVGHHEASLVESGLARYNTAVLQQNWPRQACTLGWKRVGKSWSVQVDRTTPFPQLAGRFDGALGGVRALRLEGKCLDMSPGMGGTAMWCSRTSVGWDKEYFYVLSVRDPDGEAASVRAKRAHAVQTGGWDVPRMEKFWEGRGVPNAVLFDGGESTQLAYRGHYGCEQMIHSSYHFTRTLGYIRQRPVRFVATMLPPFLANGGVLNYFYVTSRRR